MRAHHYLIVSLALVLIASCGPGSGAPDANGDIDGPHQSIDAGPPPDAIGPDLGQPCTTQIDCPDGFCVEGPLGNVCTYECNANCPDGWACRVTDVGGELVSVCVPEVGDSCTGCTTDDQCAGGACIIVDGAGYCLRSCFEGSCPAGYHCGDDPEGTHAGGFCLPDTGSCTCTEDNQGQTRICENSNGIGTCYGIEVCGPTGWGSCDAPSAVPEQCDGADNDCDQLIDDGVAGGDACTNDVPGVGSCPGTTLCTGVGGLICQGQTPTTETCNYVDDDCDTSTDEGYAGLNSVCSVGIGACERFGVVRCTADESAVECSATAGAPQSELCNAIDDDCDTNTDEDFTTLGNACSVGVGICQRDGQLICNGAGTGTACSATPGPADPSETCNGLDDTCNGQIDEGYRNQSTGVYDSDIACGSCAVNCTTLYNLPNASGSCDATGTPTCQMDCDGGAFDLDSDVANGCEFLLDPQAIYVSVSDPSAANDATCGLGPTGTGAGNHPCQSIQQGNARVVATSRARVLVANGVYPEAVTLVSGKELLGGYAPDNWVRDVNATGTLITGFSATGAHHRTVIAASITLPTMFEGFVVYGSVNPNTAGNSYAIYVNNSTTNLTIRRNVVFGGRGGPGTNGGAGNDGTLGQNGVGRASNPTAYDAKTSTAPGAAECDTSDNRTYTNGGAMTCGVDVVDGGRGGGTVCGPTSVCRDSGGFTPCYPFACSTCTFTEAGATDGVTGQGGNPGGAGGAGADAGDDMVLDSNGANQLVCYIPPNPTYGKDGSDGVNASHGAAVTGCSATGGSVVGGHWVGGTANPGATGGNGGGGGGGGAGGGAECEWNSGVSCTKDNVGGVGGGGGSGGCGGTGGLAAGAGGGAFDIFVVGTAGQTPTINNNSFFRGDGGAGGAGGPGGIGGAGGLGADGGVSAIFCADPAGRGGNGGDGGHGSGGGGGCGGSSYGIYTSGVGVGLNYCQVAQANTVSIGAGGERAEGGYSLINQGGAGSAGALATCSFN